MPPLCRLGSLYQSEYDGEHHNNGTNKVFNHNGKLKSLIMALKFTSENLKRSCVATGKVMFGGLQVKLPFSEYQDNLLNSPGALL